MPEGGSVLTANSKSGTEGEGASTFLWDSRNNRDDQTKMSQNLVRPPLEFLPPRPNRWLMATVDVLLPLWTRYRCGIRSTTTINPETLVQVCQAFLEKKARVIFAFRHPTIDDQYGLVHLFGRVLPRTAAQMGIKLDRPLRTFFVYDRGIPLWAGEIVTWFYPRMGGISVYRSKADRQGLQFIRKTITDGIYPLAIAPEGGTNECSELIRKLEPGVAQMAFWAVEDLAKANRPEQVWIVPLGFQYTYDPSCWQTLDRFLAELERDCSLTPPTTDRFQRLYHLGNHLINYVSNHYQKFYPLPLPPDLQAEGLQTRLDALLDHILTIAEYHFGTSPKGDVVDRCRRLEQMVWDQVFRSDIKDINALSPVELGFANQLAKEALNSEWHMRIAESMAAISGDYLTQHPSATRFAETLMQVWRVLERIKGKPFGGQPYPRIGKRDCRLTVGQPINVTDRYAFYQSNRSNGKEAIQTLTKDLQQALTGLIVPSPL